MHLLIENYPSPLGDILLVSDPAGALRALDFADFRPRMERLLAHHCGSFELEAGRVDCALVRALDASFAGELGALSQVRIATGGSPFQRQVWQALRAIPAGTTLSYGALAEQLGRGDAARAVGLANGTNPIAIVVPCHRVIGARGALVGYAGGMERKRWLLAHEAHHAGRGAVQPASGMTH
jgi:O-6-methylguanine DNA methyltransferase